MSFSPYVDGFISIQNVGHVEFSAPSAAHSLHQVSKAPGLWGVLYDTAPVSSCLAHLILHFSGQMANPMWA